MYMRQAKLVQLKNLDKDTIVLFAGILHPRIDRSIQYKQKCKKLIGIAAILDDEIVGLVIAEQIKSTEASVVSLKVNPSHENMGIGTNLIKSLSRIATKNEFKKINIH